MNTDPFLSSPERSPSALPVPARVAGRVVWPATVLVGLLGLAAEVGEYELGLREDLVEMFSLSYESNLPTWFASVLLFSCAALLAAVAHVERGRDRRAFCVLAALFLYISIDESVEIHEHASFFATTGVLHFSWVIPAAVVVVALGLAFLPFVRRLPPATRRGFIVAGVIYVGGALGMELPLGWWAERAGDDNLGYGVLDWIEESLELTGATLFLLSVWAHHDRLSARGA